MTEELKVVLRRSEHSGFGFSLLGTTGPPHVIYDIVENSPAADCGAVEAGDIILKVNGTDVHRYTTKEVLKCLRLSDDLVTLELKRDPKLKARIKEQLANTKSPHYVDIESHNIYDYRTSPTHSHQGGSGGGGGFGSGGGVDAYDTHNYTNSNAAASPSLRFKSPTHLPATGAAGTTASQYRQTSSANHSRSSSASSAKIQIVETNNTTTTTAASTSPTCRPSRIPTALKCPQQKPPVQHSPQHKRPRPSQIPTKATAAAAAAAFSSNGNATTVTATGPHLQHSNSYSGSSTRQQQQYLKERDPEPISAPPQPAKAPRFEAYMMTGDLILNLSRTQQSSNLLPAHAKKVDSLRDSPNRAATTTARSNGALAPRASGESSPTSSSSVESPTHTASSDSVNLQKQQQIENARRRQTAQQGQHHHNQQHQLLQQQQRDSINNSYNNSNSGGDGRQYRKDSLTNDTLLLCEDLERDDEDDEADDIIEEEDDDDEDDLALDQGNNRSRQRQQKQHQQRYRRQHYQYQNDEEEENEEDQTHYDITNIETYNSGGAGIDGGDEASDRQCLVMHYGDDDDDEVCGHLDDEEYSTNSLAAANASAKQRLRALKQKAAAASRYKSQQQSSQGGVRGGVANSDSIDCPARQHHHHQHHHQQHQHYATHGSGSGSSSSATVKSDGIGANTSQDETSFSVPTSPISLSTPLIDKETANSVPTSPEPSSLGGGAIGGGCAGGAPVGDPGVVRRHNGIVRKCDSAGFRTSKSEDHLQQIQREGIAAVIPIDIDEDVNSSLNTLLDTRQDSEDSQSTSTSTTTTTPTTIIQFKTNELCASPKVLSQRDIFNKRRRKARTVIIPRITLDPPIRKQTTLHNNASDINATTSSVTTTTTTTATREILMKKASNRERIVWTYNAPLPPHQLHQNQQQQNYSTHYGHNNSSPNSHSSSLSSSPQHSAGSPLASPTSVSSSVMSSSGSKGALGIGGMPNNGQNQQQQQQQQLVNSNGNMLSTNAAAATAQTMGLLQCPINGGGVGCSGGLGSAGGGGNSIAGGGDQSVSEGISNISSPDYQDDDNLLSSRDILGGMILSDPSDSDSTILVSDAAAQQHHRQQQHLQKQQQKQQQQQQQQSEHKLVIQVRGLDSSNSTSPRSVYSEQLKDSEDELGTATLTEESPTTIMAAGGGSVGFGDGRDSSPPVSDDGSDVESLHSYHYSPKAVDMPSAIRLAKRLYSLDGFKKSDVSRHLSKNNDFSRAVADEYLKYFTFEKKTLDQSLREFLQQFSLSGETQERERVLVHFSKRFLDCNPGSFNSQDAVHTLTCAIMLLNTDLHGQNIGRKMTCAEFVENLAELNDGENFPKDVLKYLYQAIKSQPLEWALDDDAADMQKRSDNNVGGAGSGSQVGQNPFLDIPESSTAVEYKKGYVMRKCCFDSNFKKTPFGKRSWKMFYCTLRDLVLFLHKDEHGFRKSQMSDNLHNAIRIHHALATKATDYTKKQHVFRLQTADQAEYLFQTSDSKELTSWVETINFVCAAYSAPPLEGGVGSQKRFQRPLLPSTHTKLLMKEQLESHEMQLAQLENVLTEHKKGPLPNKGLPLQNHKEKDSYLQYELRRYRAYVSILSAKILADQQQQIEQMQQQQQLPTNDEESDTFPMGVRLPQQQQPQAESTPSNSIIAQQQQQPLPTLQQQPQTQQQQQQQSATRYSYRAAIYRSDAAAAAAAAAQQQLQQQQQQQQHQQQDLG